MVALVALLAIGFSRRDFKNREAERTDLGRLIELALQSTRLQES